METPVSENEATRPSLRFRWTPADHFSPQVSPDDELTLGRRRVIDAFRALAPRSLKPRELLVADCEAAIFRLRAGWACHSCDLSNNRTAIIDVYVPGDVIGLEALFRTQHPKKVLTLTSATVEIIQAQNGLLDLMNDRSTLTYMFWLLGQRQQRLERRLAANTRFEPQARVATMVLDFYARLRRQRSEVSLAYNLPLTQGQIGDYLGLSAVHVNRVLGSLRDNGIVTIQRNCATILDLERLVRLAEGRRWSTEQ